MKIRLLFFLILASSLLIGSAAAQDDPPSGKLEIFSWWAGNEGPALAALIERYQQQYPNVEVVNATVTGGAGVNFRAVLKKEGVHDCAAGRGLLTTWSAGLPAPLRIRIDQCLLGGAVSVADVRVGASMGSDHFATINDLQVGKP